MAFRTDILVENDVIPFLILFFQMKLAQHCTFHISNYIYLPMAFRTEILVENDVISFLILFFQ